MAGRVIAGTTINKSGNGPVHLGRTLLLGGFWRFADWLSFAKVREYFDVDRSLFPLKLRNRIKTKNWLSEQMKTPASITGILGQFLAMLWLAGSVSAESSSPASASRDNSTSTSPKVVTTHQNLVCDSMPAVTTPKLSPWTKEIVKLAQSGIEEGVMVAFIENSGTFELGADQIVYLNDLGIPGSVIAAMLQHDRELVSGERLLTIASAPPYEPLFPPKPTIAGKTASDTIKPTVAPPAPVSEQTMTAIAAAQSQQIPFQDGMELTSTFTSYPDSQSSEKKRPLYPVREPRAVELLPPILFYNMELITPNTLIVYGFPKP